jgi:hypothetical protein
VLHERIAHWCRAVASNLHDRSYPCDETTAITLSGFISFGNARRLELLDNLRWREEALEEYIGQGAA